MCLPMEKQLHLIYWVIFIYSQFPGERRRRLQKGHPGICFLGLVLTGAQFCSHPTEAAAMIYGLKICPRVT